MCHLVGDYVLQIDFIAKTKGENWYHLMVHCLLYCLPFYLAFGFVWQIFALLAVHIVVDAMKARYKKINRPGNTLRNAVDFFGVMLRKEISNELRY